MNANYELNNQEENYYIHERLNKKKKIKERKADAYRYLEESTDNSNQDPSFFANEDETINRKW